MSGSTKIKMARTIIADYARHLFWGKNCSTLSHIH
jgi:hypothetical protein